MKQAAPAPKAPHSSADYVLPHHLRQEFVARPRLRPEPSMQPTAEPGYSRLTRSWYGAFKMALEWAFAAGLLVFAAPVILLAGLAVKLTSRGPIFYSQTRVGRNGSLFTIFKIRTMVNNCERHSGAKWAAANDPRITRVGAFLRKSHIDELPQLINVLRCDMSLVGPRPERPEFVPALQEAIPNYCDRLLVRPGVTGVAQILLPADTDLASVRRKLVHDLYYIRNASLLLDARLIVCTAIHVVGVPFNVIGRLVALPPLEVVEMPAAPSPAESAPEELQPAVAVQLAQ
jgi:lipopolysaccharide/colanic/teichoic acid biosynthesis glycosyltransferase